MRRSNVLLIIGLIAAALFIADVGHAVVWLRVILKSLPLVCLIVWVLLTARDRYASLIFAGLIFSLAGDVLLEISDDLFVPGLIAFLVDICVISAHSSVQLVNRNGCALYRSLCGLSSPT